MTTTFATAWGKIDPAPPPATERERVARLIYEAIRRRRTEQHMVPWDKAWLSRDDYLAAADVVIADRAKCHAALREAAENAAVELDDMVQKVLEQKLPLSIGDAEAAVDAIDAALAPDEAKE